MFAEIRAVETPGADYTINFETVSPQRSYLEKRLIKKRSSSIASLPHKFYKSKKTLEATPTDRPYIVASASTFFLFCQKHWKFSLPEWSLNRLFYLEKPIFWLQTSTFCQNFLQILCNSKLSSDSASFLLVSFRSNKILWPSLHSDRHEKLLGTASSFETFTKCGIDVPTYFSHRTRIVQSCGG